MIDMKKVSKHFGRAQALKEMDLQIGRGSIFGLLGSNGAGKTTMLKLASGILMPTSGEVLVDGESISDTPHLKQSVMFMPDIPYFFGQSTIGQMAEFYREMYKSWNQERFNELGAVFALPLTTKLHQLSKGKKRQAAFWLTLSCMPDYLLLDEPLDGLDLVMRKKVKQLLMEDVAERRMTIVISSHNLRELEDICDHIAILHNGELLLTRELDDLKSGMHKIQIAFKGKVPDGFFSKLRVLHHEERGSVHLCLVKGKEKKILADAASFQPLLMDVLPITLEEIFAYEMEEAGYAVGHVIF
ncbi:ABC-2 type transport system ATP-binding protein [Bacillus ectoiniformans]|uniref:ABC transporter ATP-binding protein n=1 Tax=Bacillus ectoiniformans TaxID=1494429 RepID=UPI00195A060D|nr:ABC transporter ATP-binding protein [Bacillus ectoiniformans]MBM7649844.1 ABC-2 type transport system ATP-binding protein [Bacillus ectoiniformans]